MPVEFNRVCHGPARSCRNVEYRKWAETRIKQLEASLQLIANSAVEKGLSDSDFADRVVRALADAGISPEKS